MQMCVIECLNNLFKLIPGLEDENPTFSRSLLVNQSEMLQMILQAAQYLPEDYVTEKILTLLGDGDKVADTLKAIEEEKQSQFAAIVEQQAQQQKQEQEQENIQPEQELKETT